MWGRVFTMWGSYRSSSLIPRLGGQRAFPYGPFSDSSGGESDKLPMAVARRSVCCTALTLCLPRSMCFGVVEQSNL